MQIIRILAGFSFALTLAAQNEPFFPAPSYFKKHFAGVSTHVELEPPSKLGDYVKDGALELSLRGYLDLVMAINPDVIVQKLNLEFSRDAITRAFSVFDPLATASFSATRTVTPTGSLLQGAQTLNTLTQPFSLQYQQTLATGAQYAIQFNDFKSSTNSSFSTFNPELNSNINFSVSQPLLRGRGVYITKLPIVIARSRLSAADYAFQDQLIQLLAAAESTYWDVVAARENLRVQQESLKLAEASLARTQKELELGATSPLEIYQPQANRANSELAVSQARFQLVQVEDALRRQIGADMDPKIRELPIRLTAPLEPPLDAPKIDPEEAVAKALQTRQDLKSIGQAMGADDLSIRQVHNNLLPNLSLSAHRLRSRLAAS